MFSSSNYLGVLLDLFKCETGHGDLVSLTVSAYLVIKCVFGEVSGNCHIKVI